jgi:hypothetical protein
MSTLAGLLGLDSNTSNGKIINSLKNRERELQEIEKRFKQLEERLYVTQFKKVNDQYTEVIMSNGEIYRVTNPGYTMPIVETGYLARANTVLGAYFRMTAYSYNVAKDMLLNTITPADVISPANVQILTDDPFKELELTMATNSETFTSINADFTNPLQSYSIHVVFKFSTSEPPGGSIQFSARNNAPRIAIYKDGLYFANVKRHDLLFPLEQWNHVTMMADMITETVFWHFQGVTYTFSGDANNAGNSQIRTACKTAIVLMYPRILNDDELMRLHEVDPIILVEESKDVTSDQRSPGRS